MRQLLEMGLVNSTKATYDGRVRLLSLAGKGTKLEKRFSDTQINTLSQVFNESGEMGEQAWLDVMRSLADIRKPP